MLITKRIKTPIFYIALSFAAVGVQRIFTHFGYQENLPFYLEWTRTLYNLKDVIGIEWILSAFTSLSIGAMFAVSKINLPKIVSAGLIILGVVIMSFDVHKGVCPGIPFITIGSFHLILNWKLNISENAARTLRSMSSIIYFVHMSVIMLFRDWLDMPKSFIYWALVIATCVLWGSIILSLSKTKPFAWIKKFI